MNTNEEILDLVDEADNVIGEVPRNLANADPKYIHREVAVIIYDGEKILFQLRSKKKKVLPNEWMISCAGHVGKGSNPEDVAHSELKEELGFDADLKYWLKERVNLPSESRFFYVYTGKYNGEEVILDPEESDDYKFLNIEEYKKMLLEGIKFSEFSMSLVERFWRDKSN